MDHKMTKRLASMANKNKSKITSDFRSVLRICDAAEVVWAVWRDTDADDRTGLLLVKGEPIVKFIQDCGVGEEVVIDAIPCLNAEQAEALRRFLSRR